MRSTDGTTHSEPLSVVVVASWFPAQDDTTKGRFIADQVDALLRTGQVEPIVVSFDPALLSGGPRARRRQAESTQRVASSAIRSHPDIFSAGGVAGPPGVPVARLPVATGGRGVGFTAHQSADRRAALGPLAQRLGRRTSTVIHAHTGYPDGAAAAELIAPLHAPLVITEHATFVGEILANARLRREYIAAVRRASRVIAVSQSLADELSAEIPDCARKLVVLPNTVAISEFEAAPNDARDLGELLYVGYRTATKGIDTLLAAFAQVSAVRPDVRLRLIGSSPTEQVEAGWRRMAAELGVENSVRFEGPALRPEIAAAMAHAGLLVHASRRETFGVATVEALASGLPVVATATGPLREILGPDPLRFGALTAVGDPSAFAAAIMSVLERRQSFDPRVLRAAVQDRYGAPAVAGRLVRLYRDVLEECSQEDKRYVSVEQRRGAPRSSTGGRAPTLVVAFNTARAATKLSALPSECRRSIWLVCSSDEAIGDLPPDLGRVIVADAGVVGRTSRGSGAGSRQEGSVSKALRYILNSVYGVFSGDILGRGDRARRRAITHAINELRAVCGLDVCPEVLCVDGIDYQLAEDALSRGEAVAVPGGLRWLADRWLRGGLIRNSMGEDTSR